MNLDARRMPLLLGQAGNLSPLTGTTALTALYTTVVPALAMDRNGQLRIWVAFDFSNSANLKTFQVTFGGQVILTLTATANNYLSRWIHVFAKGVTNSQSVEPTSIATPQGFQTVGSTSLTVDTTQSQNLVVSGQLASASDSITLTQHSVELLNF
jgi:hypothetical protein